VVKAELISSFKELPHDKKLYFASDFHLGAPDETSSLIREKKINQWLDKVAVDAAAIFLVGDIFDFWFEYKSTIPKGFIRFQGKLAELRDLGIPIILFTGNHDMWMFDYFPNQLGIPVYRDPIQIEVNNKIIYVGHGDGLGPGDNFYKFLKQVFSNSFFQWMFQWMHPNVGMWIAQQWSKNSRIVNDKREDVFLEDDEWLLQYCKDVEKNSHHDLYIFGHRHLPLNLKVSENSTYYNLGEWVNHFTYLEFDGNEAHLKTFEG
jgi:UDP-2,3-diacylglucosamine hydrolase